MDNHLRHLETAIRNGNAILFLGAGASIDSRDREGQPLLNTPKLARALAVESGFEYNGESLDEVYAAAKSVLGSQLSTFLERRFRHCKPSEEYEFLARIPWTRIYTTNIDDAFETALANVRTPSSQRVHIQTRHSPLIDRDQTFARVDLIKLHGSVDRLQEGVIFSSTEYALEASTPSPWYSQIGHDYQSFSFIIIGSSLKESLFHQQVQYARKKIGKTSPCSYLVVPNLTDLQKMAFTENNIIHLPWKFSELVNWLKTTFPTTLDYTDVAANNNPSIRKLLTGKREEVEHRAAVLSEFVQIDPINMRSSASHPGRIRNFYRGFKPTWSDVADGVPARIDNVTKLIRTIHSALTSECQCVVIYGPAGSGKSTASRMAIFEIAKTSSIPCFTSVPTIIRIKSTGWGFLGSINCSRLRKTA